MEQEIIDVEYSEVEDKKGDRNENNITVNADPISTFILETFGVVNNFTNAVKEYNICKQQEQTKRAAIKAQMKVEMEKIHVQRDAIMKYLDQQHEQKMDALKNMYSQTNKLLDAACEAIHSAIKVAENTGDFSTVIDLIKTESDFLDTRSVVELKYMELMGSQNKLQFENNVKGLIE